RCLHYGTSCEKKPSLRSFDFTKPAVAFVHGRTDRYVRLRPRSGTEKIDGNETIDLNGPRESPLNREGDRREIRSPAAAKTRKSEM
ncbi:hypothetical protein ALC57_03216, partial [Trachymyrmex cornetzi]